MTTMAAAFDNSHGTSPSEKCNVPQVAKHPPLHRETLQCQCVPAEISQSLSSPGINDYDMPQWWMGREIM